MAAPRAHEFCRSDLTPTAYGEASIQGYVAHTAASDAEAVAAAHKHVHQAMLKVLEEDPSKWDSVLVDMLVLERKIYQVIVDTRRTGRRPEPIQFWVRCRYVATFRPRDKK